MGHKKQRTKYSAADGEGGEAEEGSRRTFDEYAPDPARCLLAAHPAGHCVVLAASSTIRILQTDDATVSSPLPEFQESESGPSAVVRALAFDASGAFLAVATDDKLVRVYRSNDWTLSQLIKCAKRPTSVAITSSPTHVLVGDKFGDVYAAPVKSAMSSLGAAAPTVPSLLLGHFSSILSSLALSPCGRLLATCDRDHKIRVSRVPSAHDVAQGAPLIQSYCLGHTSYVSAATFVTSSALLSAAGDGTLRLWDATTGDQLAMLDLEALAAAKLPTTEEPLGDVGESTRQGDKERSPAAHPPLSLSLSQADPPLAALVLEGVREAALVSVSLPREDQPAQLSPAGWSGGLDSLALAADAAWDARGRLWIAGGPHPDRASAAFLSCCLVGAEAGDVPAEKVLARLRASEGLRGAEEVAAAGAGAPLLPSLLKRPPAPEAREARKKWKQVGARAA